MSERKPKKEISQKLFDEIKRVLRGIKQGRRVDMDYAAELLKRLDER
jgi:hypothetical protein